MSRRMRCRGICAVVGDCRAATVGRSLEPVTMTDKNTEIRVAVVSFRTAIPTD